ncbi:MAG: LysE family transporter [Bacteroidia bacterium]|nr:LysE family transporter [Bacteroidia bacterium]MCC6768027.1 LysE family transporter [Bacteroidia bacterium]
MIGSAIWNGMIMGLGLSFSFGPVFFMLLNTSIKRGWKESLIFDAGVLLSDIVIIVLAMLMIVSMGVNIDFNSYTVKLWSTIIGSVILIVFGLLLLLRPQKNSNPDEVDLSGMSKLKSTGLLFKGFGINFLNPSVFLIWFGSVPAVASGFDGNLRMVGVFFVSTLVFYFLTDLIKIYAARKLKRFLTPMAITLFHRISGIIFLGIATWLLYRFFLHSF